jgi:hypothetical protein
MAGVRSNADDDIIGEYMIVADETGAPEAAFDAFSRNRENLAANIESAPDRGFLRLRLEILGEQGEARRRQFLGPSGSE